MTRHESKRSSGALHALHALHEGRDAPVATPDASGRRPRHRRRLVLALAAVLFMSGCTAMGLIDNESAPTILIIDRINAVTDPFGDVLSRSGTIPDDLIEVLFTAHLKASTSPPGTPASPELGDVVLERYEVTFVRTDGGTAVPRGFQRAMNARVRLTPHGAENRFVTTVDLTILPATSKSQPPISFLIDPGLEPDTGFVNIQLDATIRFFGHTIAGEPVTAVGGIGINVANWAD